MTIIQETRQTRPVYKNIYEVVKEEKGTNAWAYQSSLSLHFNLQDTVTLSACYTSECWILFPFKIVDNKVVAYWDNQIDSKYNFEIVKALAQVDKKYVGKPFIILNLENDTTLKATYLYPKLIKQINGSSEKRLFFPERFMVEHDRAF